MRRKERWEKICMSGALWLPVFAVGGGILVNRITGEKLTQEEIKLIFLSSGFLWTVVVARNLIRKRDGMTIGLFTWLEKRWPTAKIESARRKKAQYPEIAEEYLSDEPNGLVFGWHKSRFVRVDIKPGAVLNAIVMGAPGSGKSTLLLTTLIRQLNAEKFSCNAESITFFCLDIKPELAKKSCIIKGNPRVRVMDPTDRNTYGWDPYYNLSPDSSDDEIMAELDVLVRALIDAGKAEKNEFFYESSRNIAKAELFYTYKEGKSYMQGMSVLMDGDLATVVKGTLEAIGDKPEFARVRKLLAPYADKTGEAFQGIELAMRQSLEIFTSSSVTFFLDTNPRKTSPLDLEDKTSIFFSLPETKLSEMKTLLRLVTMQVMHHCSGRPESSHMLSLVIDEAARLGAINWSDFLATSRSRQCATVLCFQSISQMQKVWGKEDAKSLIELCRIIAVLSCTDTETARMLCDWAGEYKEEKVTYNEGGKPSNSRSRTYDDKQILKPYDIMSLQDREEVLLFIKGRYMRTDVSKARYYNIKELNDVSKACLAFNEQHTMED